MENWVRTLYIFHSREATLLYVCKVHIWVLLLAEDHVTKVLNKWVMSYKVNCRCHFWKQIVSFLKQNCVTSGYYSNTGRYNSERTL